MLYRTVGLLLCVLVQVINASDVPYIVYDPVRKLFHRSNEPRRMFGDAKARSEGGPSQCCCYGGECSGAEHSASW